MLITRVEGLIPRQVRLEQKCLKKPAAMCQVPFGRARVVHGLDAEIFVRQRPAKILALLTHCHESIGQRIAVCAIGIDEKTLAYAAIR